MKVLSDTGLELYLQQPHGSERATTLALSLTLHAIAVAVLALWQFDAFPPADAGRSKAVIVAPYRPSASRPKHTTVRVPAPSVTAALRPDARVFRPPEVAIE